MNNMNDPTLAASGERQLPLFDEDELDIAAYLRDEAKGQGQWPFQVPMHIKLSMQIGGKWVGEPNPLHYPAFMEIDWVRVYAP